MAACDLPGWVPVLGWCAATLTSVVLASVAMLPVLRTATPDESALVSVDQLRDSAGRATSAAAQPTTAVAIVRRRRRPPLAIAVAVAVQDRPSQGARGTAPTSPAATTTAPTTTTPATTTEDGWTVTTDGDGARSRTCGRSGSRAARR